MLGVIIHKSWLGVSALSFVIRVEALHLLTFEIVELWSSGLQIVVLTRMCSQGCRANQERIISRKQVSL